MATPALKAARRAKFEVVFSKIRDELIDHFAGEGMPQEAVEWYRNVRACFFQFIISLFDFFVLFWVNRISSTMYLVVNLIAACLSLIPLKF